MGRPSTDYRERPIVVSSLRADKGKKTLPPLLLIHNFLYNEIGMSCAERM